MTQVWFGLVDGKKIILSKSPCAVGCEEQLLDWTSTDTQLGKTVPTHACGRSHAQY